MYFSYYFYVFNVCLKYIYFYNFILKKNSQNSQLLDFSVYFSSALSIKK